MKRVFAAVSLLMLAAPQTWAQQGKNPDIDKVRAAYEKAAAAGNVQDLVALYTADAVVMPPDMPMAKGKAAIEAFHKKNFETGTLSNVRITPMHLDVTGDTAIEVGTYRQTITPKGAQAINDAGKYIVVLKKQTDGSWKLAYEIYNSDKPVPMPPSAPPKKPTSKG
jgi:uncharacterized protein (TIGR02246 family)